MNAASVLCACASALCAAYYLVCGLADTFRLHILWVWLAGAAAFAAAALGCAYFKTRALPKTLKRVFAAAGALLALAVLYFSFVQINIERHARDAGPPGLDCIIILGAGVWRGEPTPYLRSRVDAAYKYLLDNPETVAVATGGLDPGESVTEGECIANALVELGVPNERVIIEPSAGTTVENIQYSLTLLPESCERIGIVTTDYHVYRALVAARSCSDREFFGIAAPFRYVTEPHFRLREFAALTVDLIYGNVSPRALFI